MSLTNAKLGIKFAMSFGVILVIAASVSIAIYTSLLTIKEADRWDIHTMDVLNAADDLVAGMVNQETGVRGYLVSGDQTFLEPYHAGKAQFQEALDYLLNKTSDNPNATRQLTEIGNAAKRWTTEIADREITLMGNPATIEDAREMEASGAGKALMDGFRALQAEFVEAESGLLQVRRQTKADANEFGVKVIIGGALLLVLTAAGVGFWLTRDIANAVKKLTVSATRISDGDTAIDNPFHLRGDEIGELARAMELIATAANTQALAAMQIGDGDLSVEIEPRSEHDALGIALQAMISQLRQSIGQATRSSEAVNESANSMSMTADKMNEGASLQAAASQQASAAVEEISANIRMGMENATQTEKIAVEAADNAAEGGSAVNEAVSAMRDIAEKINIVQEIARQTDLLALNAAVEAARAGEHGKGFAVVASEVRKLAERSQEAATEINGIAQQTVHSSNRAVEILDSVVPSIQNTSKLVQDISTALREQDIGASQVREAIMSLDQSIQSNLSAARNSTEIATGLTRHSSELSAGISYFSLDRAAQSMPPTISATLDEAA